MSLVHNHLILPVWSCKRWTLPRRLCVWNRHPDPDKYRSQTMGRSQAIQPSFGARVTAYADSCKMVVSPCFGVGVWDLHLVMDTIPTMFFVIVAAFVWLGLIVFAILRLRRRRSGSSAVVPSSVPVDPNLGRLRMVRGRYARRRLIVRRERSRATVKKARG
jgi:hypothetical protein